MIQEKSASYSPRVTDSKVSVFEIPTETPEADGTIEWDSTTLLLVEVHADGKTGLGYSYGHRCLVSLIEDLLTRCVKGKNVLNLPEIWGSLGHTVRNNGEVGLTSMAISAIDIALWDLKAKILQVSLSELLGQTRPRVPVYGSGGFTNYSDEKMKAQLQQWTKQGIRKFKIKVGTDPDQDPYRVKKVREVVGDQAELFVDANGAYDFQTALKLSEAFSKFNVTWFEQPIDPFNLDGMRELKRRLPAGMNLASGEYIYDLSDLQYGIENQAQDFIQLDATRCKGFTGFIKGAHACEMHRIPISSHCAPSLHVALGCALPNFKHIEYFFDHGRIENLIFDGVPEVIDGTLTPDLTQPGHGLKFKAQAAEKYKI
jgi:L-alanine-DL-glutamate epimerase-like enolase superfamily enzyme